MANLALFTPNFRDSNSILENLNKKLENQVRESELEKSSLADEINKKDEIIRVNDIELRDLRLMTEKYTE